jgi:hypothetical protein
MVVTLGDNTDNSTVSFKEAFGDYSNASGSRIQKRKERKLARIESRQEVKGARQAKKTS